MLTLYDAACDGDAVAIAQLSTLYDAAIAGDADAIAQLEIEADLLNDYNPIGEYQQNILHVESENGNTERVRFLLSEFAHKNLLVESDYDEKTALHRASFSGRTEVVKVLIDAATHFFNETSVSSFQAFLRQPDKHSNSALHIAVMENKVDIVKLLVEADPSDTHFKNNKGKTPMFIAVEKGYNDIVEIISTTCTAPSLNGPAGRTALRVKNLDQGNGSGATLYKIINEDALYAAAIAGDADAIATLEIQVDRWYKLNKETILHTESKYGNTEHVRLILREFGKKNLLATLTTYRETALHLAAIDGHTEVAEILIDAARHLPHSDDGNNPVNSFQGFLRQPDRGLNTALHIAVEKGHASIVKLLVEADPNDRHVRNTEGKTPMYIAVEEGFKNIVEIISTTCTAPSLGGSDGRTALHAAIKHLNHDIKVVSLLISAATHLPHSSDNNDPVTPFQAFLRKGDRDLNTALHMAVMQGKLATAKLLVEADPSDTVHFKNKKGETPIYIAAERGHLDIMKMICTTCTAPPKLDVPGGSTTLLHVAIKNLHKAKKADKDVIKICIDALRSKDVDLMGLFDETDEYKCTLLELAVERNHVNVVQLILKENPRYRAFSRENVSNLIGLVPLIYKAKDKDYKDIAKLLENTYDSGVNIDHSYYDEKIIDLISAIGNRNRDAVMKVLDVCAPDFKFIAQADNLGWTLLHHAAYHQFDSIIDHIMKLQKSVGYKFVYEKMVSTPLLVAAEKGYTSTIRCLMEGWPSSSLAYTSFDKNGQNILHLAASQNKKEMIQYILNQCPQKYKDAIVNQQDNNGNTTLHLLIANGCFVPEFMKYKGLDIMVKNKERLTPEDMLYSHDQIIGDQVQIKIELDKLETKRKPDSSVSVVLPTKRQTKDAMFIERMKEELERYKSSHTVAQWFVDAIRGHLIAKAALEMEADKLNEVGATILHIESKKGEVENVRFILREFANKNLLVKMDRSKQTALHLAAQHGQTQVVEVLIEAARHFPFSSANHDDAISSFYAFIRQATAQKRNTALQKAVHKGNLAVVKLLLKADPSDRHIPNDEGKTPIYIAAEKGYKSIIKEICTTCIIAQSLEGPRGKTTALHALIRNIKQAREGASAVIRMMVDANDASLVNLEALFSRRDESGSTVLELAMERNYVDAVKLLLLEDPAYQLGGEIKRNGLMRLINKAIDDKYSDDIVELLCKTYKAGIHTDQQNVLALILAIRKRDEDSVLSLRGELQKLVTFTEDNGWTPLHYVAYHEFDSIIGTIIEAQENAGHQFVYENTLATPFHVAVKLGYTSTVIRLMQSWPAPSTAVSAANSPYTAVDEFGRNILHLAAAHSNKGMVQGILKYCPEQYKDTILKQQDYDDNTPLHLLISHGCFLPELIKHNVLDKVARNRDNFTPREMLYFQDDVVAEQVHIKIALDEVQTNQSAWNLWVKSPEEKREMLGVQKNLYRNGYRMSWQLIWTNH